VNGCWTWERRSSSANLPHRGGRVHPLGVAGPRPHELLAAKRDDRWTKLGGSNGDFDVRAATISEPPRTEATDCPVYTLNVVDAKKTSSCIMGYGNRTQNV
jgi:hypothetical protein